LQAREAKLIEGDLRECLTDVQVEHFNPRADADQIEQFDNIARAHADAPVAGWPSDRMLDRRPVNVDATLVSIAILAFQASQPKNPRHDRVASVYVWAEDFSGVSTAFENGAH